MAIEKEKLVEIEIIQKKPYGCFVKILETQQDGLVRIINMTDNERVTEELMPKIGSRLFAKILHVSSDELPKISLSIKPSDTGVFWHKD